MWDRPSVAPRGVVLPFPRYRDRTFIRRHGQRMAAAPRGAERYLAAQLRVQRETMLRRDIDPALVDDEIRCLEATIRAEADHVRLMGDAA